MNTEGTNQKEPDTIRQMYTAFLNDIIPIKNEKDLILLEQRVLEDERFKNFLITELSKWKGEQLTDLLKDIMIKLFNDEVLVHYPFNRFYDLHICDVIFEIILKVPKYQDSFYDIKQKLNLYLSQTAFRISRKN